MVNSFDPLAERIKSSSSRRCILMAAAKIIACGPWFPQGKFVGTLLLLERWYTGKDRFLFFF